MRAFHMLRSIGLLAMIISLCVAGTVSSTAISSFNLSQFTERISVATNGSQGNEVSWWPSISADGRYVAFHSAASNLVEGDTNAVQDVFMHDRQTGTTIRISIDSNGDQGYGESGFPDISANGRYIAFRSFSSTLVPGDANGCDDIFIRDLATGEVTLVSVASDGEQADSGSSYPSISADGRYVAFQSTATNLVPGDTNQVEDIFVHDGLTGATFLASVATDGTTGNEWSDQPFVSQDGAYVAFRSYASNLVAGDTNNLCDTDGDGVFDDNCQDIFLHHLESGVTTRISVAIDGNQADNRSGWPALSADGRFVAFQSWADNLVDVDKNGWSDIFLFDRLEGEMTMLSLSNGGIQGNCYSDFPTISADGRYVAFFSCASTLVEGDTNGRLDIFLRDRLVGRLSRISITSDGTQANSDSSRPAIAAAGGEVAFDSYATNLVDHDTNGFMDIFVRDLGDRYIVSLPLVNR